MRQIGSISNIDQAQRFADHLRSSGIACTIDTGTEGFRVWVHDDDRVTDAKAELPAFLAEPNHQRYRDASRRAVARFNEDAARIAAARKHTVNLAEKWNSPSINQRMGTFLLVGLSIAVACLVGFKPKPTDLLIDKLWFSNDGTLNPILRGELWRLITPIFIHFSPMHILFNMMMTYQLGLVIESRVGTFKFLGMVLIIAALSNFAEFRFGIQLFGVNNIKQFGGMSGVVYGLFGYCMIKGRFDPSSGLGLNQQAITSMLVWFVLCVVGVIPNVANWAHGVGLLTGILIAAAETFVKPLLRRS